MSGLQWTHGKWIAHGCELVADSTVIATLHWHTGRDVQNKADAALIQSAPDLYAALEHALRHMTDVENAMGETIADIFSGYDSSALVEARAALARARGETT